MDEVEQEKWKMEMQFYDFLAELGFPGEEPIPMDAALAFAAGLACASGLHVVLKSTILKTDPGHPGHYRSAGLHELQSFEPPIWEIAAPPRALQ
jgi:hypothetical protein